MGAARLTREVVNFLGDRRPTSGPDPTPSKRSRHLVVLEDAAGCRLHIQLSQKDLAARNFEAITLNWVSRMRC